MNRLRQAGISVGFGGAALAMGWLVGPLSGPSTDETHNNNVTACELQLPPVSEVGTSIPEACRGFNFPYYFEPAETSTATDSGVGSVAAPGFVFQQLRYDLPSADQFHKENFLTDEELATRQAERWRSAELAAGIATAASFGIMETLLYPRRKEFKISSQRMFAQLEAWDVRFEPGRITHDTH